MSIGNLIFWFLYCFVINSLFLIIDKSFCQVHKPLGKRKLCQCIRCRAYDICPYTLPENIGKDFKK